MRVQVKCDCAGGPVIVDAPDAETTAIELAAQHGCPCHVIDFNGAHLLSVTPQVDERGSPPSTYAALAVLEGRPGAWGDLALKTLMRAPFIALGMRIAGVKGWRLWLGSTLGSTALSGALLALYAWKRHRRVSSASEAGDA